MIAAWVKFWAMVGNAFHIGYNGSLVGRINSDKWVADALQDTDVAKVQADLKALGLYIE